MPGPGRGPPGPPGPAGPPARGANMPGPGRGPPGPAAAAGRGAAGRGGIPGTGPPAGRGIAAGEPGRGGIPGTGPGADAGRGAAGRGGMPGVPSDGEVKGLLPGRGPGAGRPPGAVGAAGAAGAAAAGAATGPGRTGSVADDGPGLGTPGPVAVGLGEPVLGAPGLGTLAPEAAGLGVAGAAAGAAGAAGKASRTLRATGASMVEEALLTNSPLSFNQDRRDLLSRPSSFASSWTRALPGTVLLRGPGPSLAVGDYCMGVLIGGESSRAHGFGSPAFGRTAGGRVCRCSLTGSTSSGPGTLRARLNARRRSARSTQVGSGCTEAPRPGRRPARSTVRTPATTTTRSRADLESRSRHPTHVRTGLAIRASDESTAPRGARAGLTPGPRPRCRCECRCASRSGGRQAGRSDPPCR